MTTDLRSFRAWPMLSVGTAALLVVGFAHAAGTGTGVVATVALESSLLGAPASAATESVEHADAQAGLAEQAAQAQRAGQAGATERERKHHACLADLGYEMTMIDGYSIKLKAGGIEQFAQDEAVCSGQQPAWTGGKLALPPQPR